MPPPDPGEFRVSKVLFNRYEVGRLLGCGAFAKVYHARNLRSGQSVAIKIISKSKALRSNLAPNIRREITIMRRLHHPHVIRLLEVLASRSKIYFVLEFAKGGELFARIAARGRLPEDASRRLFQQLISAIGFCHARGVFHRDLKPENLLLDDAGDLKVSDFGLSAVATDQIRPDGMLHTLCGTPAYVAPEILAKKGYSGAAVDIWSCGVILFVLNTGYLPFNDPNLMEMYRKIYRGEYRCPRWMSPELRGLIARLLDTNPETRITVDGIIGDPWFRKGLEEERMKALMRFHEEVETKLAGGGEEDDRDLNAFDIISFSSGFDLSGLFGTSRAGRSRYVSDWEGERVLAKVEEVGRGEGLVVRRRRRGRRGGAAVEGRRGNLVAWVEVQQLTVGLVVVEVEREGDGEECEEEERRWSEDFWRLKLEPALKGLGVPPLSGGQVLGPPDPVHDAGPSEETGID